jgi:putative heme iron utilization protein
MTARKIPFEPTRTELIGTFVLAMDRQEKAAQALESANLEALKLEFNEAMLAYENAYYDLAASYDDIDC